MGAVVAMAGEWDPATEDNWMFPPEEGWTAGQVRDLELPFDWELVDGVVVPRGQTRFWHNRVRDRIAAALDGARRAPYEVVTEQCVLADAHNTPKPDIVVFGTLGLDFFEPECLPPEAVSLVVEAVPPGSRQDDRGCPRLIPQPLRRPPPGPRLRRGERLQQWAA